MTAPLADRILAELAEDPKTEDDLVVCFPKAGRDVIRAKVHELKRAGKIADRSGVYQLRPGEDATAAVQAVEADRAAAQVENTRKVAQAISAARRQRVETPPTPAPPPPARVKREPLPPPPLDPGPVTIGTRVCTGCKAEKPLADFPWRSKADGERHAKCRSCYNEYFRERDARKRARSEAAVEQMRAAPKPAAAAAPPAAADAPENVLQFPAPKSAPKTLEDVVNRRATVSAASLESIVIADPVTGRQQLVLSADGLRALREHLAGTAAG